MARHDGRGHNSSLMRPDTDLQSIREPTLFSGVKMDYDEALALGAEVY